MSSDIRKNYKIGFSDITRGSYLFVWPVAGNYRWVTDYFVPPMAPFEPVSAQDKQAPWLIEEGSRTPYSPIKDERIRREPEIALHREFVSLKWNDQDDIVSFAKKYGNLGKTVMIAPQSLGTVEYGESLQRWNSEIMDMAVLVAIWDMLKIKSIQELKNIVKWKTVDHVSIEYSMDFRDGTRLKINTSNAPNGFHLLSTKNYEPELIKNWSHGDVLGPALFFICKELNAKLKWHFAPQILPFRNKETYILPDSLLHAMWLLFMWEVSGLVEVKQCESCLRWIRQRDPRQKYCDDNCKQRAYDKNHPKSKGSA